MSLNNEERRAVVEYRLEKATTALEQAKGNIRLQYWEVIANRIYYAAYYAVSALLISYGHSAKSHEGIIHIFGLEFTKKGLIHPDLGRLYNKLYTLRLTGDYNDHYNLEKDDVIPLIPKVEELIASVTEMTRKRLKELQ